MLYKKKSLILFQVTVRNSGCVKFLQLTSCVEIMLSLLVIILNILFIFYGMNSGWYYFVDSLGTELEVNGRLRFCSTFF